MIYIEKNDKPNWLEKRLNIIINKIIKLTKK